MAKSSNSPASRTFPKEPPAVEVGSPSLGIPRKGYRRRFHFDASTGRDDPSACRLFDREQCRIGDVVAPPFNPDLAAGELRHLEFTELADQRLGAVARHVKPSAAHEICHESRPDLLLLIRHRDLLGRDPVLQAHPSEFGAAVQIVPHLRPSAGTPDGRQAPDNRR